MRMKEIKSKNIYQRFNGEIIKYEVANNNTVIDTRTRASCGNVCIYA